MEIGFSLGSNQGDRLEALRQARDRLRETPGATWVAQSPVYETEPVGVREEYRHLSFLNAVVVLESDTEAGEWLHRVHRIERELGRVRGADRFAPRPIDIDVLYCGEHCLDSGVLIVPHPRWAERRFVVQPLADVRPDLVLPGSRCRVQSVLAALSAGESVVHYAAADAW